MSSSPRRPGEILVYDGLDDPIPEVFADLRKQVYDSGDRGVLGLALDPNFPASPYVYALYTFDHVIGEDEPGKFPHWGQPPTYEGDPCPKPPSADVDACPVSGRLVRLQATGNHASSETVLIEDWCQQSSSHSIGDLQFGPEGALFASGGEGAGFGATDFGEFGWPHKNQCGDPPGNVGEALTPPTAEGGGLRAQDLLTPGDPTGLDGTVIRIDPATAEGWPGNPLAASNSKNERRIIGFGFRNPFRFSINDESHEVYVGNVGNVTIEEIDRFSIAPQTPYNSGWPCFEGNLQSELRDLRARPLQSALRRSGVDLAAVLQLRPQTAGDQRRRLLQRKRLCDLRIHLLRRRVLCEFPGAKSSLFLRFIII